MKIGTWCSFEVFASVCNYVLGVTPVYADRLQSEKRTVQFSSLLNGKLLSLESTV